jgi:hypothetical protein
MGIVLQDSFGRQYLLEKKLTIGSDSSNRIVLLDSSSSPFHAELSLKKKGGVLVKDKNSENGVFINNNRVTDVETAFSGDTIQIGKVTFTLLESIPDEVDPEPSFVESTVLAEEIPVTVKSPGYMEMDDHTLPQEIASLETPVEIPAAPPSVDEPAEVADAGEPEEIKENIQVSAPSVEVPEITEAPFEPAAAQTIEPASPASVEDEQPVKTDKPISLKWILIVIAVVFLLGAVGMVALFMSDSGLQDMVASLTGVSQTGSGTEGPSELNLKDPALNTVFTSSFIQKQEDQYTGAGNDGSALTVKIIQQNMEQSTPGWSNYTQYQVTSNGSVEKASEFSILNKKVYKNDNGGCSVFADTNTTHAPSNWPKSYLKSYVTGKARKVESGVTVNGVITDKYELKLENSPFAYSLTEMKSGELYRAQKGGYLVKLSITETWQADKWQGTSTYGFATGKPVTVTNTIDFTYYPNGKLNVIVPGVCAGKIKPAQ